MKQETLVILVMFMAIGLVGVIAVETYNLPQVNAKGCLNSRAPFPHNNTAVFASDFRCLH